MCIRDSYLADLDFLLDHYAPEQTVDLVGHSMGGNVVMIYGCLLYTSDAADDLLCVDLGGRRIIKKKNRTHHHITTALHLPATVTRTPTLSFQLIPTSCP